MDVPNLVCQMRMRAPVTLLIFGFFLSSCFTQSKKHLTLRKLVNQLVVVMTLLALRMKASVLPHHVPDLDRYVESAVHVSDQLIASDRNEINQGDFKSLVATDMLLLYYESQQDDRNEGLQTFLSQTIDTTFKIPFGMMQH